VARSRTVQRPATNFRRVPTKPLWPWLTGRADTPATVEQADQLAQTIIQDFLEAAVRLFGADGAAVVLYQDRRLGRALASDAGSLAFALAQAVIGEGPWLTAMHRARAVPVEDLLADPRWPRLVPDASAYDVRGLLVAPVVIHGRPIGTYSLTTASPRSWTDNELDAVLTAARVLGTLLEARADVHSTSALAQQLQDALRSRIVIEQAKGALVERLGISPDAAFGLLRTTARASRLRVVDLAVDVLAGKTLVTHRHE
jgi:GAF domain-containing protein